MQQCDREHMHRKSVRRVYGHKCKYLHKCSAVADEALGGRFTLCLVLDKHDSIVMSPQLQ